MEPKQQLQNLIEGSQRITDGYKLIDELINETYHLNNLIGDLTEFLADEDERLRLRATQILTYALMNKEIPTGTKDVYIDYLASRLIDSECIEPILNALIHLVTSRPSNDILETIVMSYACMRTQLYSKEKRVLVYRFFKQILPYIQGEQVVDITVNLIELERDPECLLETFELIKIVSSENEIDVDTAPLLFDCASAYFPILYAPRGNEELRINLTNKILEAFTSSPFYAQFAIPFLMDKLEADLSSIKLEALKGLYHCIQHYELKSVYAYFSHIWDSIETSISTLGIVEINEITYSIVSFFCNLDDNHSKPLIENIQKFCIRMLVEEDDILTSFVNGLLEELTQTSEMFFKSYGSMFMKCFTEQFEESKARPRIQFERELFIVKLLYKRVLEGMPLLNEMKGRISWDLHVLATPTHPCFISLLDIDVSLSLLDLIGEQKMVPLNNCIEAIEKHCTEVIPIIQRLLKKNEEVTLTLLNVSEIIKNLELISGIGIYSSKLFSLLLQEIPKLQSNEYVPVLQSLLLNDIPEDCYLGYIQNIVPIFIKITEHELSPLFSTLSNRLSRLHSLFSKDQIKELTMNLLTQLKSHSRLLVLLPSLLQFYQPENLFDYLKDVETLDKDTLSIYALLVSTLTETIPQVLNEYQSYYYGYKSILELSSFKSNQPVGQNTTAFIEMLCSLNKQSVECLKEMLVFNSLTNNNSIINTLSSDEQTNWKIELFKLVYEKFISTHSIETLEEAHLLILLFSLLPVEDLMTYEMNILKTFKIICKETSEVNEINSIVSLFYNIIPIISKYPMSIIENELQVIIESLFTVLYINGSTIKYRCDIIDLLTKIRYCYGIQICRPYQKYVTKKLLIPLDDNKRLVRQSAAVCKNIWDTLA